MTRSSLAVRFPDGAIRYGLFNGGSSQPFAALLDSEEQAWDELLPAYRNGDGTRLFPEATGDVEDVEVYSDYGGGYWWPGRATRDAIVSPLGDEAIMDVERKGRPAWYAEAFPDDDPLEP